MKALLLLAEIFNFCGVIVRMPVERGAGEFSRVPRRLGAPQSLKTTENGVSDGFFLTENMLKIHFRPVLRPDPAGGAYDAPPNP